jgi:hypothetical protein
VSRSAIALTAAALGAALLAPASAQAGLVGWHDAEAGVPATVTLKDVARDGETVIAVGKDTVSGEAVIYRLTGGAWQRDPLLEGPLQTPVAGELSKVAAAGGEAWAVGTDGAGKPLLVHLAAPATPPAATPPQWQRVDAPIENTSTNPPTPAMGKPTSLILSGATGYVGDDAGRIWSLSAGTVGAQPAFTTSRNPARVNGIAFAGTKGIAVTDATDQPTATRIFTLDPNASLPAPATPDAPTQDLLGVAIHGNYSLAIDSGAYWEPTHETWSRVNPAALGADGPQLADVKMADLVDVLGGQVAGAGYVWRRVHPADTWTRNKVSDSPINAVAAGGREDVWAVGDKGVVKHFNRVADPVITCDPSPCGGTSDSGSGGGSDTNTDPGTGSNPQPDPNSTPRSNPTTTTVPPADPGDPTIYVVEPDRRPATRRPGNRRPRPQRRLLDRVAVTREARRLVVSFRLTAPARVAISATRGRATVARAVARAMRAGRRRVSLPFTGAPPTELRIVVRPLPAKRAGRARGGNAGA